MSSGLLGQCHFDDARTHADLAVSGGPDSLGLLLLALEAGRDVTVHHVDHHARATSGHDADHVRGICQQLDVKYERHDVVVEIGANFESRARAARRAAMPPGVLTGHTMDDLAETVLLNMLRGAGLDGLSPMVNDWTKPLRDLRGQWRVRGDGVERRASTVTTRPTPDVGVVTTGTLSGHG